MVKPYIFSRLQWGVVKLLLICAACSKSSPEEDGFTNFITQAIQTFPDWMISTGRDPAVIPYSVNFSNRDARMTIISGYITDQKIARISELMSVHYAYGDLPERSFYIEVSFLGMTVEASYYVEGEIMPSIPVRHGKLGYQEASTFPGLIPVSGKGPCTLRYDMVVSLFSATNLGVTPAGYFNLSAAAYLNLQTEPAGSPTSTFDGISAGGYEDNVIYFMNQAHFPEMGKFFPVPEYLKIYFTELFESTPISEIIATTAQPSTTPTMATIKTSTVTAETTTGETQTTDMVNTTIFTTTKAYESTTSNGTTQDLPRTTTSLDATTTTPSGELTSTIYPCISTSLNTVVHNETVLENVFIIETDGTVLQVTKKMLIVSVFERKSQSVN